MTTFDEAGYRHLTPVDNRGAERQARLRQLGLGEKPEPEFEAFAKRVAKTLGVPNAMVNFVGATHQYVGGLYSQMMPDDGATAGPEMRTAPLDTGYCPHVIARGMALVLEDVCDYPRFAGNDIVDRMNVRSYLGAPLIDRTGTPLGTLCVIDSEPRPWGRDGLHAIKSLASEGVELIHTHERERQN
ncbi:GAF domain-containing protein [Saccharopolyspora antimicrobica]|uniref:GAF domain-containing protein n=1 Tax=Saccharopolyspora antimicrobica TaxID=455193 RepID=A0A1I5FG49_9PSEU|nr:GAF domain-containing protein [Saccharopolyspora antimicrobica]RKT82138.1 GAF domain-containing protein [Saccharopolyspora antimicrobica]SFO22778.1 GAF domain-containing protein [Saccharopolyspora antimicrobica]